MFCNNSWFLGATNRRYSINLCRASGKSLANVPPRRRQRFSVSGSVRVEKVRKCHASLTDDVSDTNPVLKAKKEENNLPEVPDFVNAGRSGFLSFYNPVLQDSAATDLSHRSLLWLVAPLTLVGAIILPPAVFRTIFGKIFQDSIFTDFVVLFFTEAYFYIGVAIFLITAHELRSPSTEYRPGAGYSWGYRISTILCTTLSVILAAACFALVWKSTGPASIAALVPYMFGFLLQFCAEHFVRNRPAIRPLVPIIFQVYRLHQLNKAAQLVGGLMFSLRSVEATPKTLEVTGSLQMILAAIQVLGSLSLWSLATFLMQPLSTWEHGKGTSLLPF